VFGVPNLSGPGSPAGAEYGITQIGDNPTTNGGLSGVPLITNQVIFTLAGLPSSFNVNAIGAISNITFQYGTSLSEARSIPEPGSLVFLATGGALLAAVRRRRRK
jgi:hypothetical protein